MAEVPQEFRDLIATITKALPVKPLEPDLAVTLQGLFPPGGATFDRLEELCRQGRDEGWLCAREAEGIKFGRPVKPGPATDGFSVDVVEMTDKIGPHHRHPKGEIDMVMPLVPQARFDTAPRGWKVYGPGSAHRPTVTGGGALILYLLPDGAIEFTGE